MCAFCSAPPTHACAWPVTAVVLAKFSEILLGDRIRRVGDTRDLALVVSLGSLGKKTLWLDIRKQNGNIKRILQFTDDPVEVDRGTRPCGAQACDAHVREVGESVGYALCHWEAWKDIAADPKVSLSPK